MTKKKEHGFLRKNWFAIILTILTIIVGWTVFFCIGFPEKGMSANAVGDWLAGFAASLGFIWLIASYRLQAKELSSSIKELAGQKKALRKSNKVQKRANKIQVTANNQARFDIFLERIYQESITLYINLYLLNTRREEAIKPRGKKMLPEHLFSEKIYDAMMQRYALGHKMIFIEIIFKFLNDKKDFKIKGSFHELFDATLGYIAFVEQISSIEIGTETGRALLHPTIINLADRLMEGVLEQK